MADDIDLNKSFLGAVYRYTAADDYINKVALKKSAMSALYRNTAADSMINNAALQKSYVVAVYRYVVPPAATAGGVIVCVTS